MGTPSKFGWNRGGVAVLNRKPVISLKRGEIGPMLLLVTNRKLHMRFRLVPKSMILDDLERPLRTPLHKTHASSGAYKENLNEDRRLRCGPMTLVSRNISFIWIFAGVSWRWASNDSGVIENVNFQCFRTLNLRKLRK